MRTAANLTNSTEWQKAFLLCPVKWHCTHIINANCIAHIPVMQVIGIGILPNDCDTLAFIGHGHSMRAQTKQDRAAAMVFSSLSNNKRMLFLAVDLAGTLDCCVTHEDNLSRFK
jgi:hypothetical protein